jgi:hypothetical protein
MSRFTKDVTKIIVSVLSIDMWRILNLGQIVAISNIWEEMLRMASSKDEKTLSRMNQILISGRIRKCAKKSISSISPETTCANNPFERRVALSEEIARFVVDVKELSKALSVPKESVQALKGVVGGKMLSRMKKESVDCPVRNTTIPFILCFSCDNFLRRVKGKVDCKGGRLQ